jgi:[ribosomal protein S18]-alanine N-acetyltransferase
VLLMLPSLTISTYDRSDLRAETIAVAIMGDAFDPRYGEAWTTQQLSSFTYLSGVTLNLAQIDNCFMGFSLTRTVADEMELLLLAVSPQWQGRGVGKKLLESCISHARLEKISYIFLEVRENNDAIYFYETMGFEHIHRRPSYYKGSDGKTYDALSYRIDL